MKLQFVKMQGAGNDYVYLDGIRQEVGVELAESLAPRLADRHFGVGGDGTILLAPSDVADCRMVMWNADGSRGAMCGNGIRCVAKLAHDLGAVRGHRLRVETDSGVHDVELCAAGSGEIVGARVSMLRAAVDTTPRTSEAAGRRFLYHRGDAGVPHAVVFVEGPLDAVPVETAGRTFQDLPDFPDGTNVEFVRVTGVHELEQRTYERGTGETLACGTGATVAAVCALQTGRVEGPEVSVRLRGGVLKIRCDGDRVTMEGPATTVFCGTIEV